MKHNDTLQKHREYIFRQSMMGSVAHIAIDHDEVLAIISALRHGNTEAILRLSTWCGKSLKYGSQSNLSERTGSIRNACEFCFIEWYDPEHPKDDIERPKGPDKVHYGDLPF